MFSKTMRVAGVLSATALLSVASLSAFAQEANPTTIAPGAKHGVVVADGPNGTYIYHVKVVERDLDAVNYLNRSGSTKIAFKGTNLMPNAYGEGKVESATGKTNISVNFKGLTPANGFGPEYLTYVLWAISADGRPQNLGELELAGDKASLSVSSSYQSFGMIVTAEPYFAVSQPSDVVVLQNVFSDKTEGILQHVNIHYSLLPKGLYANTGGSKSVEDPITDREHYPLALYEAHNAARIALAAGAEKYAPGVVERMRLNLKNADDMQASKHRDVKMIFTQAREATQRAEDARLITLRKQAAERSQAERDARASAESQAAQSQQAAADAQAQADRAAAAKAQADADRARAEAEAARARSQADAATQDAAATREKLKAQLNGILATSENARGLIVNMNDVLFDTAKYTLKPATQVSLAKVATILQLYPDLKVHVEGYTDSVGGDDYNQKLSENRANAVKDFLTQNGVPADNVTSQGYGKTHPVADNGTKEGRAQNRRVNLVVSGAAIGVKESTPDSQQ
ncbi:MAG: OmpA family protein [Acidobacteriaceae bacterium]|nr:OmpA family protein [Acidobacteriaceae bacterium]